VDGIGDRNARSRVSCAPPISGPDQRSLIDKPTHDLFEEKRVALRTFEDFRGQVRWKVRDRKQLSEQLGAGARGEGAQRDLREVLAATAKIGVGLRHIGPGGGHRHKRAFGPTDDALDRRKHRFVGPMEVLEHEDSAPAAHPGAGELRPGARQLLRDRLWLEPLEALVGKRDPGGGRERHHDRLNRLVDQTNLGEQRDQGGPQLFTGDIGGLVEGYRTGSPQDLAQCPVGDPSTGRKAAAAQDYESWINGSALIARILA